MKALTPKNKQAVIDRILDNPTYRRDSGMRIQVNHALRKLPYYVLANLELIIKIKETK